MLPCVYLKPMSEYVTVLFCYLEYIEYVILQPKQK